MKTRVKHFICIDIEKVAKQTEDFANETNSNVTFLVQMADMSRTHMIGSMATFEERNS